jgi:hypothetical protein
MARRRNGMTFTVSRMKARTSAAPNIEVTIQKARAMRERTGGRHSSDIADDEESSQHTLGR